MTAALAARYAALHATFATTMVACRPAIRSQVTVSCKNAAREALKGMARRLVRLVNGAEDVTTAQKISLGLNIRGAASAVPRPDRPPALYVVSVSGRTVKVRLMDAGPGGGRGKPTGVSGASLFTYVGSDAPANLGAWRFEGNVSRVAVDVTFGSGIPPGTAVWLTAFWFNDRKQGGPPCVPVLTYLQGGSVAMAG